jgi:Holliday junction resolvase RusA-like endonuclease
MTLLIFNLPYLPPASYSPNSRASWAEKRGKYGDNNRVLEDVRMVVLEAGWDSEPMPAARVWVTFHLPTKRKLDHDNLTARMKPIFDALVTVGVLADDSIDVIGWPTYGHVYSNPAKTVIEIELTHWGGKK